MRRGAARDKSWNTDISKACSHYARCNAVWREQNLDHLFLNCPENAELLPTFFLEIPASCEKWRLQCEQTISRRTASRRTMPLIAWMRFNAKAIPVIKRMRVVKGWLCRPWFISNHTMHNPIECITDPIYAGDWMKNTTHNYLRITTPDMLMPGSCTWRSRNYHKWFTLFNYKNIDNNDNSFICHRIVSDVIGWEYCPVNTQHVYNIYTTSAQRRRWFNIV